MIRVAIADDHKLVREAWTLVLGRDLRLKIVGEFENGQEAIDSCRKEAPDVILMDINMTPVNGIDATRKIKEFNPHVKIIGVSTHADKPYVEAMIKAGASGYVTKNSKSEEMVHAILEVMDGRHYLCEEIRNLHNSPDTLSN